MKQVQFRHVMVNSIPDLLQANILYVTTDEDVAGHLCACGCGREVITPLSPADWSIAFDRQGASLSPSIGNWAFPCRSHYFIWNGVVVWARNMSDRAIAHGRRWDKARKQRYYDRLSDRPQTPPELAHAPVPHPPLPARQRFGHRLLAWCRRLLGR